jgi:hypothetical protein
MSGARYVISDQHVPYFITCTVIKWIDLFMRQDYRDVIVDSLLEKIDYIHNNPVKAGWVEFPEFYLYSSASDYCSEGRGW